MISPTLPAALKSALDAKLHGLSRNDAAARSARISRTYRDGGGSGTITTEADARAYGIEVTMRALGTGDARILTALANAGMKPEQLIAVAFQEIAGKADRIGQLNISPDLLREVMATQSGGR